MKNPNSLTPGKQAGTESPNVTEAKEILRGKEATPKEILELAKRLKEIKSFNYARRVLARAAVDQATNQEPELELKIHQQWALCTYKDNDLPADARLDHALKILRRVEKLDTTKNQETLGLVGAVYKRKWEIDNQKQQLERSLLYYKRGYQEGAEKDQGYTGINAAFVLDLLAYQEEDEAKKAGIVSTAAGERREEARRIREVVAAKVAPLVDDPKTDWLTGQWWFYMTVVEAYFGLKEYEKAIKWFERGIKAVGEIPEWETETAIRQLARLAIIQSPRHLSGEEFENSPAWRALEEIFGGNTTAVRSAFIGKIGLALSGGGFRASLFHIGTLAKLAELDVLRHIEVLSCVSGGSIIGAHYYLKMRKLLHEKADGEIKKEDYLKIVEEITDEFLAGVQRNVRVRIAAEPLTNLKMIFSSKYSRTKRAGELYEEVIFSKVNDGGENQPRYFNELNIYPKGETENFAPKLHNWRRAAKAPVLVLNATTLNTGHNWQFTTTWMGEPPSAIDTEVDTNDQLRRMYYAEAPPEHQKMRLGYAVAASAGVPGIFEPLSLENLYPKRIVRLVDGGVCDNQGINSLLEQDCTVILVSDASGQMESQNNPSNGLLGVPLRSNSILQARIRDAQYHDLERRRRASLLRGMMFIHLKQDLDTDPVDWIGCLDPFDNSLDARPPERRGILTNYGIAKDIQKRLAAIRTDLDSFSDIEAYALMTSAYRMTEYAFKHTDCVEGVAKEAAPENWKFLEVEKGMKGEGEKYQYLRKMLGTSGSIAFKVWKQSTVLKYIAIISGVLLSVSAVLLFYIFRARGVSITVGAIGVWLTGVIFFAVLGYIFGRTIVRVVRWRDTLTRIGLGIGIGLFGWFAARIHLHVFDKMFLKRGNLNSLNSAKSSGSVPKSKLETI